MKKETFRLLFLSVHLLISAATTTAATLRTICLLPILVFLKKIGSQNSLDAGIHCIHQGLHLSHSIFPAHALIGRVHENITPFLHEFHADGFDRIRLNLRQIQIGLHFCQHCLLPLAHGGCITPHSTTLGVCRREGKKRYDQCSASDRSKTDQWSVGRRPDISGLRKTR